MPKFSANLSMMFTELPFLERFEAAARAGFAAVEYVSPYEASKQDVAARLRDNNLTQALFNLPPGDWGKGERGIGCHSDRIAEFKEGVGKAIEYADALNCKTINCLAGIRPSSQSRTHAYETLVSNLAYAAAELQKAHMLLVVEPINAYDIPGFLLNSSADGLSIMDAVKSDNLRLQYDFYHMQRTEGELAATVQRLLPRIGHIQIADNPGRHEPGTGELNYPFLFRHLDNIGYAGWVGCEYKPKAGTVEGLGWMKTLL